MDLSYNNYKNNCYFIFKIFFLLQKNKNVSAINIAVKIIIKVPALMECLPCANNTLKEPQGSELAIQRVQKIAKENLD